MENIVSFELENNQSIDFNDYDDEEFAIARMGFLASCPNSHGLEISDEVLKECAPTALGKWVVSKYNFTKNDLEGHEPTEQIMGIIPKDQEVEFVEENGYLRAYVNVVVSKIYAKDFCEILNRDNSHAVSVEMKVNTKEGKPMNDVVESFNIVGVTVLGTSVKPSCANSEIELVRFSKAIESYFDKLLMAFEKKLEEKENYVEHPIDTSKGAMYDGEWDGAEAKKDLVKEKNYKSLAPKVCLRLEEGWEERQVTNLGYPVMGIHDGKWVYFKKAISSALAYAKQEKDEEIVNKVEKLYKKLDIKEEGKEGESKMAEIEFAAVDIGDMWGKVFDALHAKYPEGDYGTIYRIEGIYEEGNKKFAVIRRRDEDTLYRLDFTLTEEGLTLADEVTKVEVEIVETDEIRKFAEPENVEKYRTFAEEEKPEEAKMEEDHDDPDDKDDKDEPDDHDDEDDKAKMSCDEMMAKIEKLEADIADRDNIIMGKDAELEELRAYKNANMEAEKATKVEATMSAVEKYMDKDTADKFRSKGMECAFEAIDAWVNEVKASVTDECIKFASTNKNNEEFTRMSAVVEDNKKTGSVWERL